MTTPKNIRAFCHSLLRWYRLYGRDLPWRRTSDPYAILVSEFMLQQTQVATVIPYYNEWLARFPNVMALARAPEREVLRAWEGLGYYARARNLRLAAKIIAAEYGGRIPSSIDALQALPGIGSYTANAIAAFAFDQPVSVVDSNIARLLARLFNITTPIDSGRGRQLLQKYAMQLLPKRKARIFNSALMDLGALVCLPRAPKCSRCPVRVFCRATNPEQLPIKKPRPKTESSIESHRWITERGQILLERSTRRWRGMWILPPLRSRPNGRRPQYTSIFPFTHHKISLRVFAGRARKIDNSKQRWIGVAKLESVPVARPHRRAILHLLALKH